MSTQRITPRKPIQKLELTLLNDETPLSFESPESSLVLGSSYDVDSQQLSITLRAGTVEHIYDYPNIPPSVWLEFLDAGSKGAFFNGRIRPLYTGKPRPKLGGV